MLNRDYANCICETLPDYCLNLISSAKSALQNAVFPLKITVPDLKNIDIVLCGFSPYSRFLVDALLENGTEAKSVSVVDSEETEGNYRGIEILPHKRLQASGAIYIICSNPYAGLYAEILTGIGVKNIIPYNLLCLGDARYDCPSERYNSKISRERILHLLDNKTFYSDLLDRLADNESKVILAKWILFHLTLDARYLAAKTLNPPYFGQAIVPKSAYRVFWDFGGFDGDTLRDFLSLGAEFDEYRYFEPDEELFRLGMNSSSDPRVKYHNLAMGRSVGVASFTKTGSTTGKLNRSGTANVTVETVDNLVSASAEAPTCIKMDVEGGEYDALMGAEGVIRRYRPALMISVEHKPEDIMALTELIASFCADYKFYMRYCADSIFTDLTLFAVIN